MPRIDHWQRVAEVFEAALAVAPEDRERHVVQACGDDAALEAEVLSLLAADLDASTLFSGLRRELVQGLEGVSRAVASGGAGRVLGAYTLEEEIGRGGMGEVYRARRTDQAFEARVAVKLLGGGPLTEESVRRFHRERQILASLDHPDVARLLDGGTTDDGRPYLVMEYVEGVPIDVYCDRNRLGVAERLRLVRQVCSAVQRAHQNLVVHRDLKPANVLVTKEGRPKLLDFGIAKLLEGADLPQTTDASRTGHPMTLTYASPEQLRGERITTATDVYSLGVMLHRLLTGELPYRSRGVLLHAILHEDATPPSTRVTEEAARLRRTSPRQLRRALAGDLDNLLRKALAKDPLERYGSAEELGADLERHLRALPVAARAPSLPYRLGKLVRRNPALTAVSVALLGAVLTFGIVMAGLADRLAAERDRARQEERTADQVSGLLVDLFTVSDPAESRGENITAREVLDRGAERLETEIRDQPEVRAMLLEAIGKAYQGLGLYGSAEESLTEALRLRRSFPAGPDRPETLATLRLLGGAREATGNFAGAEETFREALALSIRLHGEEAPDVAEDLNHLTGSQVLQGRYDEAEPHLRRALAILERSGIEDTRTAATLVRLGSVLTNRRSLPEAEAVYRQALEIQVRELGHDHPDSLSLRRALGTVIRYRGRLRESEALFRELLAAERRVLGEDHPNLAYSLTGIAYALEEQERLDEAEPLFREALELRRHVLGPEHPAVGVSTHHLAHVLEQMGRHEEALDLYQRSLELLRRGFGDDHPFCAYARSGIGRTILEQGRAAEAEPHLRRALEARLELLEEDDTLLAGSRADLGSCLTALGRFEEAEELLLAAWRVLSTSDEALERSVRRTREDLVVLYEAWGRPQRAAEYVQSSLTPRRRGNQRR